MKFNRSILKTKTFYVSLGGIVGGLAGFFAGAIEFSDAAGMVGAGILSICLRDGLITHDPRQDWGRK